MIRRRQLVVYAFSRQFSLNVANSREKTEQKSSTQPSFLNDTVTVEEIESKCPVNGSFLERAIGASYHKWQSVLEKHPELKSLKRRDIMCSAETLKSLNYNIDEILEKPMILYNNTLTLQNRYKVLKECGFSGIRISVLAKFVTAMRKSVLQLKTLNCIPYEEDVLKRLLGCFKDVDVQFHSSNAVGENVYSEIENTSLRQIRQNILNNYLRRRLDMTDADITKLWKVYGRVRHKSFHSVQDMVQLLLVNLKFPKERINKNAYLLHGEADNVRRILSEIPTINNQPIEEIVFRRPKILMSSCDALVQTLAHVRSFGISEDAVLRCLEVLTLGPDTVLERLLDLQDVEEFKVLISNPRVLRLVHYQNKARMRLEYLNQLKVRCASLHILSCGSEAFVKFAREGSDRTKGRDIIVYLSNCLQRDEQELRNVLSRHPNWCHIPVIHVKQCYEFLLSKKFSADDIFQNIHLLLYPIKRITEKLEQIQTNKFPEELQLSVSFYDMTNNQMLTLIMYLIENEFHFTGDGIWTDQHTQHVENFHNLLPDFPESLNKIYKYGTKPANKERTINTVVQT